jgi:hypothetical protein
MWRTLREGILPGMISTGQLMYPGTPVRRVAGLYMAQCFGLLFMQRLDKVLRSWKEMKALSAWQCR